MWPKFPKTEDTINVSSLKNIDNLGDYYLLKSNDGCGYTLSPCTPFLVKGVNFKELKGYKFYYLDN